MIKIKHILYSLCLLLFMVACNKAEEIQKIPVIANKYDPSKPIAINEIIPTRGIIDQTFIINGNFPTKLSDIKVYFGDKKAVLTATDGISVTGLVPKQPDGLNQISVVLGSDSIVPDGLMFKYKQSRSVKTIAGKLGVDQWMSNSDYAGAPLDAVTFGQIHYVAALAGVAEDNIFLIETGWGNRLILLSQDDNQVQVLSTPDNLSCPTVNSTRDAFYVTTFWDRNHGIYYYSKANSWEYSTTGITVAKSDLPGAKVPSLTFGEDDNWLYLMDVEGRIAEVDLHEKTYKVYTSADKKPGGLNPDNYGGEIKGDLPNSFGDWTDSFITYSKYHKCFFVSFSRQHAIYKLVKNADNSWTSTLYAGNNGQGIEVGHRLIDARLNHPHGMVVNEEGEIFVANKGSCAWCGDGHVILRIVGDVVDVIAGKPGSNNPLVNGDPLEATFKVPNNLSIDSDGNYIISGGDDRTVRKLSIE